jgi:hypothetical protein
VTLPKESELPLIKARAEARHAAMKRLLEIHSDEYDELHREERVSRGLPAETDKARMRALEKENAELRELLKQYSEATL